MNKNRKSNKWMLLFTLFVFLVQTAIPPALFARGGQGKAASSAAIPVAGSLFDENMPFSQQQLLFEFIEHIADSFEPREGLRAASEKLTDHLKSDQFWFDLDISDPEISELLEEANESRRYLLRQAAPVEERLHAEQRRIEKQLLADSEHISGTGRVPDGFMERNQGLLYLYDLQDDLWEMKIVLLHEAGSLSENVLKNYISRDPQKSAQYGKQAERSLEALGQITDFAASYHHRLTDLKAGFRDAREAFNMETAAGFYTDRIRTGDLIQAVAGQSGLLKQQGDPNARRHAELLDQINEVLKDRVRRIDQTLGDLGATETYSNPLYVAPGLGVSDETRRLTEDYRTIARDFIQQTRQKAENAEALKAALADIQKKLRQEHLFFQTLLSDYGGISAPQKSEIVSRSTDIVDGFAGSLEALESELDEILRLAGALDFEKPDVIIGSKTLSSRAFTLNRAIEKFIVSAENVGPMSTGVEIRLYSLLADIDAKRAEQLRSYGMLEESSLSREEAVDAYLQKIQETRDVFDADARLAADLKELGRDIMAAGESFFRSKTGDLSRFLGEHQWAAGQPYYDYLTGVHEQLETRLQTIKQINAIPGEKQGVFNFAEECPDCVNAAFVWPELAGIGDAYSESLQQIDDLSDIESFYSEETIQSGSVYDDARNLFELNKRLGNQPYLHMNPDSFDVVFTAGSQMVVVKGIGDPGALDFVTAMAGTDHLLQTPRISGGGFLQKFRDVGDNGIKPIGRSVANTASGVISGAGEIGGRIVTATGHYAGRGFESARSAVRSAGSFGSEVISAVGAGIRDTLGNTWDNAVKNDDGSYSWLKIGTYVVGGVACGAAAVASAGLAAPACVGLAISGGVNLAQGYTDTLADYGWISDRMADWTKLGLDIAGVIGGGAYAIKHAVKHTPGVLRSMSRAGRIMTRLGLNPNDLRNLRKIGSLPFRDAVDAISTGLGAVGWGFRLNDWGRRARGLGRPLMDAAATPLDWMKDLADLMQPDPVFGSRIMHPDDITNSDFIRQVLGVRPNPFAHPGLPLSTGPGSDPQVFNPLTPIMVHDPNVSLGELLDQYLSGGEAGAFSGGRSSGGGGAGFTLPGAGGAGGQWDGDGDSPGFSLIPGDADDPSQASAAGVQDQHGAPEHTAREFENPYRDWENPYKDWENPYKNYRSPLRSR